VTDGSLRKLPVGGTFQASPQGADMLLDMLRDGLGLRIRRESDHVYISRAEGK
jgi:transmembrane sensor